MYKTLVDAQTLKDNLNDPHWVVVDTRSYLTDHAKGHQLYLDNHITGAFFLDMEADLSGEITEQTGRHPLPDWSTLVEKLRSMGIQSGFQVVVYDDMSGAMAARLWWLLRYLGHESVAVLDGGFPAWIKSGGSLSDKEPNAVITEGFNQGAPLSTHLTVQDVQTKIDQNLIQLVDARAAARFVGEIEPIDPVAGHVPGALNRSFDQNLTEDGFFKSSEQLKQEWRELIDGSLPVVHMCGSGVTACHNMLAMEHAGLKSGQLYAGSWSEWIRDPLRPVATDKN